MVSGVSPSSEGEQPAFLPQGQQFMQDMLNGFQKALILVNSDASMDQVILALHEARDKAVTDPSFLTPELKDMAAQALGSAIVKLSEVSDDASILTKLEAFTSCAKIFIFDSISRYEGRKMHFTNGYWGQGVNPGAAQKMAHCDAALWDLEANPKSNASDETDRLSAIFNYAQKALDEAV